VAVMMCRTLWDVMMYRPLEVNGIATFSMMVAFFFVLFFGREKCGDVFLQIVS
jgi:hypothetical protein